MQWIASSFWRVSAVWDNCEALVQRFGETEKRSSVGEKRKRHTLQRTIKVTSIIFILDIGLMCDPLEELSDLRLDIQEHSIVLYRAGQKLKVLVQMFEEIQVIPGPHCKYTTKIAKISAFM
jgi:hypothetical protein